MTREIVRVYAVTCVEAYMMSERGSGYSLDPWGTDTRYYKGYDDGGKEYLVPAGYHVGTDGSGARRIYDQDGYPCEIISQDGGPALATGAGSIVRLQEVQRWQD